MRNLPWDSTRVVTHALDMESHHLFNDHELKGKTLSKLFQIDTLQLSSCSG